MPKGDDVKAPSRAQQLKGTFNSGPGRLVKGGRGKNAEPDRVVYDKNYNPASKIGKKTFDPKKYKAKTYAAGSNVLDREKTQTFDDAIKGARANDPRNWEFHYKSTAGKHYSNSKGATADEKRRQGKDRALSQAKKQARTIGKDLYGTMKIEYETKNIKAGTAQMTANSKAMGGRFGSTRAAKGVAAAKQLATRRTGSKQDIRGTEAFSAPAQKKTKRIA